MWTKKQITQHIVAAQLLTSLKDEVKVWILHNNKITELEISKLIVQWMNDNNLTVDGHKPIVAFGKNTSYVHYFPTTKTNIQLKKDTLILLDIWARLNEPQAPYADMTWMFWYGKQVPHTIASQFITLIQSRNVAIRYIKKLLLRKMLPVGREVDLVSRNFLKKNKLSSFFKHSLGHSIGTRSPHGIYSGFRLRTQSIIKKGIGYTIEPGIYFENKYGLRTELDIFISRDFSIVITTPVQKAIECISVSSNKQ